MTDRARGAAGAPDRALRAARGDAPRPRLSAASCKYPLARQSSSCTLVTTDGHVTLSGRRLITTRAGQGTEVDVDDPRQVLADTYGVRIATWPSP